MIALHNQDIDLAFECQIVGYQFPHIKNDRWDSNWCLLKIAVSQAENRFEACDPALEAYELTAIRNWFKALSENKLPSRANLCFTEPCIALRFLGRSEKGVRIIIELACELKPDFKLVDNLVHDNNYNAHYDEPQETEEWEMVFTLTDDDFRRILAGLDDTINKYPVRG